MNAGPGRFTLIISILFATLLMGATDYRYSLHLSKSSLYLKEPLVVTFDINQTDSSKVMFFDFEIDAGDDFFVHRLDKEVDEAYHARKERYRYLVYPLKSGTLQMRFKLLVRRGNDELLTTAFTGGRYNVKAVETDDRYEPVASKIVEVKPLPLRADLVGRFRVERTVAKSSVESYEPLYVDVKVSGTGYAPDLDKIAWLPPIKGVKLFVDRPKKTLRYTRDGMTVEAVYRYALMSQSDFKIAGVSLQAFDTAQKKRYRIELEPVKVNVTPVETSLLLDKKSTPKPVEPPTESIKRFFIMFLIFAAGWISAVLAMRLRAVFSGRNSADEWKKMVKSSKDARELMKLLVLKDAVGYKEQIEKLERAVYAKEAVNLKRIKKEVLNEN